MLSNIRLNKVSADSKDVKQMLKAFENGVTKGFLRVYIPLNNKSEESLFPDLLKDVKHSDIHIPFEFLRNPIIDGNYIEAEISYANMRSVMLTRTIPTREEIIQKLSADQFLVSQFDCNEIFQLADCYVDSEPENSIEFRYLLEDIYMWETDEDIYHYLDVVIEKIKEM